MQSPILALKLPYCYRLTNSLFSDDIPNLQIVYPRNMYFTYKLSIYQECLIG